MALYIWLYRLISVGIAPILIILLFWRVFKKKENRFRIKERFGHADMEKWHDLMIWDGHEVPLHKQSRIWIHAASVGEANSAWVLACELLELNESIKIIFTTTTLTSSELVEEKIAALFDANPLQINRITHQFLPFDSYFWVEKFFGIWRPKIGLLVESEIWPNLLFAAREKKIPLFLVNARISDKSFRNWLLAKRLGFQIFDYFTAIFAQSENDQLKISSLTKNSVLFYGNLKAQPNHFDFDLEKLSWLETQIGQRPVFLCASTHQNEEEIIVETHKKLKSQFNQLLTIIVPRHPNRGDEVVKILSGQKYVRRSLHEEISGETDFYLVDTLGELGTFYRFADFAFIGGSLVEVGGHNPFEAIAQNCAVISGDKVSNFHEIYQQLVLNNSAILAKDSEELFAAVAKFLNSKKEAEEQANRASDFLLKIEQPSQKIIEKITQISS